uniref:Gln5 n=1 Tax=Arundo donax TaxID=35708 RepID=A0A0A9RX20_ARUDO
MQESTEGTTVVVRPLLDYTRPPPKRTARKQQRSVLSWHTTCHHNHHPW